MRLKICDEIKTAFNFIYIWYILFHVQFQSFSIYRCKIQKKLPEEIDVLRNNPKVTRGLLPLPISNSFIFNSQFKGHA